MWDQGDQEMGVGGGGFLTSPAAGDFGSPGTGASGEKKSRLDTIVPLHASTVSSAPGDQPLKIADQEVSMVVLAGHLDTVDKAATKISFQVRDKTGAVEVIRWVDSESSEAEEKMFAKIVEDMLCTVVARVRPAKGGGPPTLQCFDIRKLEPEQYELFDLEVWHARLKMEQCAALARGDVAAPSSGAHLPNSTVGGGGGGGGSDVPMVSAGGVQGLKPQQNLVLSVVQACHTEEGLHIDQIAAGVRGKLGRTEVVRILEELSNEGHVYNSTDDETFRAIDCGNF